MDSWDVRSLELQPHHPQVLRSDAELRAIAIRLSAGEELQEHQTYERGYLFVCDGTVEVYEPDGAPKQGGPGALWHFQPAERRRVVALDDARIVLVLAPWPGEDHPTHSR